MISSEVQRTLVKSPPELWAELSDPASLARHLGELGEIRITRAEPEQLVEWEAPATSGTVAIRASAWGTRVTLTANRELAATEAGAAERELEAEAEPPEAEVTAEPEAEATAEPEAVAEPEAEATAEPEAVAEPEAELEPEPRPEPLDPATRRGFLARLFRRWSRRPAPQPDDVGAIAREGEPTSVEPASVEPTCVEPASVEPASAEPASAEPGRAEPPECEAVPAQEDPEAGTMLELEREPGVDLASELKAAEDAAEAEVTAILSGVLDRLGAAHHRPFSHS